MKKIKFNILTLEKKDGINVYSHEEKEGFLTSINNRKFLVYQNEEKWVISDFKCGVAIVQSNISFVDAKKKLKEIFNQYLSVIETQEYQNLCGVYRDVTRHSQLKFDF